MKGPRPALWPRQALMGLVQGYRLLLKPWLGNACRFEPSCSAYALQALERHGALHGGALTGWRLLRCHPWCDGGCDPVPDNAPRSIAEFFTRPSPNPSEQVPAVHPPTRKSP